MSQDKQGYINVRKLLLENHGFEDVSIINTDIPDNLLSILKQECENEDEEDACESLKNSCEYYRVNTKQGNFGIFIFKNDFLDLTDTGILISEFLPEQNVENFLPN